MDENLVIVDEDGAILAKKDFILGIAPPPPGSIGKMEMTDYQIQPHGQVATVTYINQGEQTLLGQTVRPRAWFTEEWQHEPQGWKMFAIQFVFLTQDPPAQILPPKFLTEYVGAYQAAPGAVTHLHREGDRLVSEREGRKPQVLSAEARDVFFIPGNPTRKVFERDSATGRITGFVDRTNGQDLVWKRSP